MKKSLFLLVLLAILFTACHKKTVTPDNPTIKLNSLYILNQGNMDHNNSSISYYNLDDNSCTADVFTSVNNRGLGDTGNDLKQYGSRMYCLVDLSGTIEVMDLHSARVIGTIFLGNKEPRRICFDGPKAYVSCFDGTVIRFDTASLAVEATVTVGPNPEGICVANNKLYVANSGGLDIVYGTTVSVIDLSTFSVMKNITVVENPSRLYLAPNQSDVYLISVGNYGNIKPCLQKISSVTDEVVRTFDFEITNMAFYGSKAYLYSYDYFTYDYTVKVMDVNSETIVNENFISDGTVLEAPFGIAVNPQNGDVYVTDAHNFVVNGDVYCFGQDGKKKFSFEVEINPSEIVFLN